MNIQTRIEATFQREIAAGRLTRQEATILCRQLDRLAFNMTVSGYAGELPKAVAAAWMLHLCRYRRKPTNASAREHAHAARWWALGASAGVLHETKESLAFADRAVQDEFCLHFCTTRPWSPRLLRLMARETFSPIWHRWAQDDPTLADRLNALLLADRPVKGRLYAAQALRYLDDLRIVDPLLAALDSPAHGTCTRAARALAILRDQYALEPLNRRQLQEEHLSIRVPLIEALGCFGPPAIPFLAPLLSHPDQNVFRATIRGLGKTGAPEAAALLVALLTAPGLHTTEVDEAAVLQEIDTLNQLVTSSFMATTTRKAPLSADQRETFSTIVARSRRREQDRRKAEAAVEALGTLGEVAVPALLAALDHEHPRVRAYVASALGQTHAWRAAGPLLAQLRQEATHASPSAANVVGNALLKLHCRENVELMAEALVEPNALVRSYVACALADLGDRRATEPLLALLQEHDPAMRARAIDRLGKLRDPRAIELLIGLVKAGTTTRTFAATQATQALVRIGTRRALAALQEVQHVYPPNTWIGRYIRNASADLRKRLDQRQTHTP